MGWSAGGSTNIAVTSPGGGGIVRHMRESRMNLPRNVGDPSFWFANCDKKPDLLNIPTRKLLSGRLRVLKTVSVKPVVSMPYSFARLALTTTFLVENSESALACSSNATASHTSRMSRTMAAWSEALYSGNKLGSFAWVETRSSRMYSSAKSPIELRQAGAPRKRSTAVRIPAGAESSPFSAESNKAASGRLFHNRNERREAISKPLKRSAPSAPFSPSSGRYKKLGDVKRATVAQWAPSVALASAVEAV